MNALTKKIFPIGLVLLLSACAHYSRPYYPDSVSYGGGYTVVQRDYYQAMPRYGYYNPGRDHFHDLYRPHWHADSRKPPHPQYESHYHPARKQHEDSHHWVQPHWQHQNGRPRKEDRGMPDHAEQQRFREGSHQGNGPRRDYTAPVAGHSDQRQFGGIKNDNRRKNENHNPRRQDRGMPNHAEPQRSWNNDRQQHGNRGNDRRMAAPGQERRQRPDRGNPHRKDR